VLEDGRRQIVNFILPGDTCDAHIYLFSTMDHLIATLTPVVYSELERVSSIRVTSTSTENRWSAAATREGCCAMDRGRALLHDLTMVGMIGAAVIIALASPEG